MSGIVGSRFNIRGSGLIGSLGTDGQVFTSAGAGKSAVFEAAAGGGKVLQCVGNSKVRAAASVNSTSQTALATDVYQAITPQAADNKILVICNFSTVIYDDNGNQAGQGNELYRDVGSGFVSLNEGGDHATGNVNTESNQKVSNTDNYTLCYSKYGIHYWDHNYDTTNEVTYKLYIAEMQVNDSYTNIGAGSGLCNIVLMEIDQS